MLRFYVKKSFNEEPQEVSVSPTERAWIYGSDIVDAELVELANTYELDLNTLRDVRDLHELPHVESSKGALYVFVRTPRQLADGSVVSVPLLSVLKGSNLFSLSSKAYFTPEEMFEHMNFSMRNNKQVLLQLLSYVVLRYEHYIHQTDKYIRGAKRRLRTHEVDNKDFIRFVTVEADLNEYRTNLSAMGALLTRIHDNKHTLFTEKDCEYIEDITLHINQLLVMVESHFHAVDSIRNAYTTISNNNLSRRMKALTLLTVFITLPNVVFGMYGMNVTLPGQNEPFLFLWITGITASIILISYLIARRFRF